MADGFFKIKKGLNLGSAAADPASPSEGDFYLNTGSNVFKAYVQGAWRVVTYNDQTGTLTNKTISGSSNTITNVTAANVVVTPASDMVSTDVQAALEEHQADIEALDAGASTLQDQIDAHLADTTAAHAASAISFTPSGSIAASNVQTAVAEVATDAAADLTTHAADTSTHGVGEVVGTTETQTISGKTFSQDILPNANNTRDLGASGTAFKDLWLAGNAVIGGNLQVDGTTVTVNSTTLDVVDKNITVNKGGNDASSEGAGITVDRTGTDGSIIYKDASATKFAMGAAGSEVDVVGTTSTQTLTNKTIGNTNTINAKDSAFTIDDNSDATKQIKFNAAGTTGTATTITGSQTANRTLTLPDATDTLVGKATTDTLTNKTLNSAQLNSNTLGDCTVSDFITWNQFTTPSNPSSGSFKTYFKSDGKLYKLNSSGTEVEIGSGGAGGINYFQQGGGNPDAESGTTGWTGYDDGAAVPVDLTGGSVAATLTRNTTTPQRGTGDFLFTAGGLGEGFAYTITPDSTDILRGAYLAGSVDLKATATLSEGDYQIWAYDVTNSTIIQCHGYKLPSMVAGVTARHYFGFQLAVNGTTWRIGIHQAVASPAGNLKFDNISIGPTISIQTEQVVSARYTVTNGTQSFADNGQTTVIWQTKIHDTHNAMDASTGIYTVPIAGYYRIHGSIGNSSSTSFVSGNRLQAITRKNGSGDVVVDYRVYTGSISEGWLVTGGDTQYYNAGDTIVLQLYQDTSGSLTLASIYSHVAIDRVGGPITSASEGDGRVVALRVNKSADQTIATNSDTNVTFPNVDFDTHGGWNGTDTYTIPVAGKYRVYTSVVIGTSTTNTKYLLLDKNGVNVAFEHSSSGGGDYYRLSDTLNCVAGDLIKIQGTRDTAGNFVISGDSARTFLTIERLSGSAAITPTETIAAYYESTSTSAISTSNQFLDFATKVIDTHGGVTGAGSGLNGTATSTWRYVCPAPGIYEIKYCVVTTSANTAQGVLVNSGVYKNGVIVSGGVGTGVEQGTSTYVVPTIHPGALVQCVAGDYLSVGASNNTTPSSWTLANGGRTYVSVRRI